MPAVSSIALNDAQGTPVLHTFIPLGPDQQGVWWFEDQSAANVIGYPRISVSLTRPLSPAAGQNSGGRMNRLKMAIHLPSMETVANSDAGITPPPTVAYICRAQLELMLPERASLQNRKDLRKYAQFLFADAAIIALAENLQNYY